jgi:hypothetical protein
MRRAADSLRVRLRLTDAVIRSCAAGLPNGGAPFLSLVRAAANEHQSFVAVRVVWTVRIQQTVCRGQAICSANSKGDLSDKGRRWLEVFIDIGCCAAARRASGRCE